MKHKTKHILPRKLFYLALVLTILLLGRWLITSGRVPVFELSLRWVLMLATLFLGSISAFITFYEYHGIGSQEGIFRKGIREPYVSITFDDGPDPKYTPKILDVLKEKKVRATFFVTGKSVEEYPQIARRIVEEGHDIGNHTFSHKELVPSTRNTIIKELTKTDEAIQKATGITTDLFRPPRGIYSHVTRKLLVELGYKIILWSVSSVDWRRTSPNWILNRIRRYARMGSIILFHDGGALVRSEGGKRVNTVKALPMVIDYLHSEDLEIIPISALIKKFEIDKMQDEQDKNYDFSEEDAQKVVQ